MTGRTLSVTLADELDAEVKAAVAEGEYASAEEAIVVAVSEWCASRRLDHSLDVERLRRLWQEGIESGPGRGLSMQELKSEARKHLAQK